MGSSRVTEMIVIKGPDKQQMSMWGDTNDDKNKKNKKASADFKHRVSAFEQPIWWKTDHTNKLHKK